MRIIHLNANDTIGGAAIAAKRLRDSQRDQGADAILLVGDHQVADPHTFSLGNALIAKVRFVVERFYFRFFEKSARERFAFSPLVSGISLHQHPAILKADILHLHWVNFGFFSPDTIKQFFQLKKPIFITLHDMWWITGGCHHAGDCERYTMSCGDCTLYLKNPAPHDLSHRQWIIKQDAYLPASIHWIACSEWLAKKVRASSLGKSFPVSVVPNPLDMAVFSPGSQSEARISLDLDPTKHYILVVAAKVEVLWKGIDLLIAASHHFPAQTELLVVGQMEASTAQQMGVPVKSMGVIRDPQKMARLYQAADVFVISSRFENLPNTLMEAMGCGIPCVGFSIGGIPEMIDHLETGYVASPFDPVDLAHGVQLSLQNKETWGKSGAEKALRTYKKEVVVQQILDLYTARLQSAAR